MFILLGAYPISVYLYINKIELHTSPDPHGHVCRCQRLNVGVIVAGFIGGNHRPSLYVSSTPRYERDSNSQH